MKFRFFFKVFIILFAISSAIVMMLGILDLMKVDQDLKNGLTNVEKKLEEAKSSLNNASSSSETFMEGAAIAVLTFKSENGYKIGIYNGLSKETLKFGAAKVAGSANPCSIGNCVLYGHRDSAFRIIPKTQNGDLIEVQNDMETLTYKVKNIFITDPEDPKIFEACNEKKLTLVTCYPFTFVGPAPQRCIVEAYAQ